MPGKDTTVWKQNDDGSWTRNRGDAEETTYYDPTGAVEVVTEGPEADEDQIDATDGAVAAADELGVDLASVVGTGADGRITKADVEAAAKEED